VQLADLQASNIDEGDRVAWDLAVAINAIGRSWAQTTKALIWLANRDDANNREERSGAIYVFYLRPIGDELFVARLQSTP